MTTQNIALFKAFGAKMDYLNQRQRVISQNISNTDTPGYKPKDLVPVDFSSVLKGVAQSGTQVAPVALKATNPNHMPPSSQIDDAKSKRQKETYEVAPAGNAVIMEEQLLNANKNISDYNLMASLYEKNVGLLKIALGTQR